MDNRSTMLAAMIDAAVKNLKGVKTQKEIAAEAGYKSANIIAMMKSGDAKVALDRIPALSKVLRINEKAAYIACLYQFHDPEFVDHMVGVLAGGKK
ncbi:hypothetical protein [Mangrovicoccus sp. HB161399]|uniref:hypothetical protein n=1 Tax=Mangrovicoccus sp. HB161399 TaxID=2720392 RepID=UPI001557028D|nr:hypothetical protein [Mangrovicoccus sp. HB161399]